MKKYYAVRRGRKIGIYNTWEECKEKVYKYSGAVYKSFFNLEDAREFINQEPIVEYEYKTIN